MNNSWKDLGRTTNSSRPSSNNSSHNYKTANRTKTYNRNTFKALSGKTPLLFKINPIPAYHQPPTTSKVCSIKTNRKKKTSTTWVLKASEQLLIQFTGHGQGVSRKHSLKEGYHLTKCIKHSAIQAMGWKEGWQWANWIRPQTT